MHNAPFKLASVCFAGIILWLSALYLVTEYLPWPRWLSYGLFAIVSSVLLYYVLRLYARTGFAGEHAEARELGIRYQLLSKATSDAIYDWDAVRDSVVWNHGLYTLFGYEPHTAALRRQWWEEKLHPEDRERVLASLQEKLDGTENFFEEQYRLLCANGLYKTVLSRGYIIRKHNTAVRMVGLIQDIDHIIEKKQIIRRLQEQNAGLREIARINSHEVRRPVVSILGIAQLFDKSHQDKALNTRLIEWLQTSTSELDELIHKLEEKVREIETN
ncbi:PAS domain-containing protein [Chitinophaga japonensis]|uniref:histidine kinase n=1 Tax=Chitinophaga japonensis TaxID=104662 RepID=A0A562TCP7_CHIJA|nr:PAS domain-containing protein [Chitinophaga japonensis]TWI91331.1 PAS domain S-box-containing protein [Chitinophaga japonensis]